MPAKELTPEQKADAGRLLLAFKAWQQKQRDKGHPSTQAEAAFHLGFNQSSLSQYLNGSIPLNAGALVKFAALFGVDPVSISPDIVAQAAERSAPWVQAVTKRPVNIASRRGPFSAALMKRIAMLDSTQLEGLEHVIEAHLKAITPKPIRKRKHA